MSDITPKEIKHIATLARLKLTDVEVTQAARDLAGILDHFAAIQAIDTDGVPESDNVTGITNVTRPDKAAPEVLSSHAELLERVPETQDDQIKVKAVFS